MCFRDRTSEFVGPGFVTGGYLVQQWLLVCWEGRAPESCSGLEPEASALLWGSDALRLRLKPGSALGVGNPCCKPKEAGYFQGMSRGAKAAVADSCSEGEECA